ncbi:MAG: molybdenum cofactor biosynthesis protein [Candidatus Eisenbacteria bacterium]|jgi:cyclic pyranopterin phosphate synthase
MSPLSHLDARGRVRMVDVSPKPETAREAVARGRVTMLPATLRLLRSGRAAKGDVLTTAHLAAVNAAKRTGEWIPLAHPLRVEGVDVVFAFAARPASVLIECRVRTTGRTGVEMEALTAVAAAALTLVDMLKAADRTLTIGDVALWEKRGGRSGTWVRSENGRSANTRSVRTATPRPRSKRTRTPRSRTRRA